MLNKWQKLLLAVASVFVLSSSGGGPLVEPRASDINPTHDVNIHFFYSNYCAHCSDENTFLDDIQSEYGEKLHVVKYLIDEFISFGNPNPDYVYNTDLKEDVATVFEIPASEPLTSLGGKAYSGFNAAVEYSIRHYVEKYLTSEHVDVVTKIMNGEAIDYENDLDHSELTLIELPLIGIIEPKNISLALVAMVLGFVDGFNPCAMWVLLFLISLLLPSGNRKRIFILAGTFLLASAVFYFALMMAWINTATFIAANLAFRIIVGVFALAAGGYNLYQFIKSIRQKDVGCEVTDDKRRVKLMDRVQKIVNQNVLLLAIPGVILLAVIVNFIELACSAGLPLVFANIMALNGLGGWSSLGYVLIYIFFFILDDLVVFTIVMLTLKIKVVSNKIARYNHLIGGILMIVIGILMIFLPRILQFNF
ncbi:MAG: hypothetical protein WC344_03045 [Bacilli bacterium]|jgi:thiol-disulfide isomerase/thioredoxin